MGRAVEAKAGRGGVITREALLSLYLPAMTLALGTGIAAPAIPVFAKSFAIDVADASWVFTIHMVGGMLATLPTGYLIDRVGRRRVALAGPIIVALSSFAVAIAQSYTELLVYRFIGGAAQQVWMLSRLAIVADTGRKRERGRQITGMVGMEMTGRFMAPGVGGLIAAATDVRVPFIVHGVLSLLAVLPSFTLLKESAPGRQPSGGRAASGATQVGLAALLVLPVLAFFLAQFLASLTRGTLFSGAIMLFPVYAYGVGPDVIGLMATAGSILGIPIVFTTGALMDRFGRKVTVVPGFLLLACALGAMAYIAAVGLSLESYVVAYLFMHMCQNLTSGNMQVIGADIAPPHLRGKFFGVWRLIGEIGTALSPLSFAFLAERSGYAASFVFLSSMAIGTAVVLILLVKDPSRRSSSRAAAVPPVANPP